MRLLEMSFSAGVLILLVAFFGRSRFWKLSRRAVMLLWMVVLARLLLPGSLPIQRGIAVPVYSLLQRIYSLCPAGMGHTVSRGSASGMPQAASCGQTGFLRVNLLQAAGWIWLVGMCGAGVCFFYSYWKEYQLLAQALVLESAALQGAGLEDSVTRCAGQGGAGDAARQKSDEIRECCQSACRLAGMRPQEKKVRILVHDQIRSPLVFGMIRQSIVLPKGLLSLEQPQMQHILTHEMVHIRRHDNLRKLFCAAAVCVHWFNPAVWLMYLLFARDLELCCDEQVLAAYGRQGRQEYAMTLLTLAKNPKGTTLFCSGFWENPVKERIVAIMKYKKLTGTGILCAGMLLLGATSVFATNGQAAGTKADADQAKESLADTHGGETAAGEAGTDEGKTAAGEAGTDEGKTAAGEAGTADLKSADADSVLVEVNTETEDDKKGEVHVTFRQPVQGDADLGMYSYYVDDDGKYVLQALDHEKRYEIKNGELQETEDGETVSSTYVETYIQTDVPGSVQLSRQRDESQSLDVNTEAEVNTEQTQNENVQKLKEDAGHTDMAEKAWEPQNKE